MRLIKRLLMTGGIALAAGFVLFLVLKQFGLRVESSGTGITPVFTFHDPEEHYEEIEAARRETPAPTADPVLAASEPYWTDFRGPRRDGVYSQQSLRLDWSEQPPAELWRQKVGGGYASMVVARGLIYTIEQRRDQEVVAAYDLATGRQVWEHGWPADFQESMGGDGPRATPTWAEGKLFALGAEGELRCLDATSGELVWKTDILADAGAQNITWGMAGAPLVYQDSVIVFPGGQDGGAVAAYDAAAGRLLWSAQSDKSGYAAPQIETLLGEPQLLLFSGERIAGLDPNDGSLLWAHPWSTSHDINVAQPIKVDDEHVLVSSGYGHGAALLKLVRQGDQFGVEIVWEKNTMKNKFNSSVLYEGHVYGLDESILAAVDVRTGERKWKGGRYGFGQLLFADGRLIVLTESGEVVLVKATPAGHEELARFSALDGKTWNVPALADGILLVRNQTEMAAYDLRL